MFDRVSGFIQFFGNITFMTIYFTCFITTVYPSDPYLALRKINILKFIWNLGRFRCKLSYPIFKRLTIFDTHKTDA